MDTTRGHIHEPTIGKQAVRIDRKSAYGNQFKIDAPHPDTGLPMTRDDVCDLFEERQLPNMDEPPHLNWSTVMFRKRRTENGEQATQARGNNSEAAAG